MLSNISQAGSRQAQIVEVVFRNGWDYMRRLLSGGKPGEPSLPPPAVLRNILIDLGPVYVKLGQLLSTRPDLLPSSYIEALSTLQEQVPAIPWSEIEILLRQQFKQPLEEVFEYINIEVIAAGSIAQTYRATLRSGIDVAIKIQRPGIDRIIEQDIGLLKTLGELVALTDFGENYDIVSLANEFGTALRDELDFTKEARYTEKLRQNLSESRWFDPEKIMVPQVYWELTTPKVLVLEWLNGTPILSANLKGKGYEGDTDAERQDISRLICRAFFKQFYIDGFFHADPHPGNLFYLDDGRVALLDCGLVGRLDPQTQQILTELLLAVVNLDAQRCTQLTLKMAEYAQPKSLVRVENEYAKMLRKYYNVSLSEINFSEVFYEILELARNNRVKLPSNLGLYSKTVANLEGVARTFNPQLNLLDEIKPLMRDLLQRQLLGDDPIQTLLRTALDVKSLSLQSPRQLDQLLDRITSETIKWNITIREIDPLRRSVADSANRLSFSIVVGALIMGAAIVTSGAQSTELTVLTNGLFGVASFLGLWLIVSILRSGRLK
ncbi:MAG: AarF/ABC1/UbiB kinase family protein [Microcoleaceae cyanobacterium]